MKYVKNAVFASCFVTLIPFMVVEATVRLTILIVNSVVGGPDPCTDLYTHEAVDYIASKLY
jgi:hypothetical protein